MKQIKILFTLMALTIFSTAQAVELQDPQSAMATGQLKMGFMFQEIIFEQSAIAKLYKPRLDEQKRQVEARIEVIIAEFQKLEQELSTSKGIATEQELQEIQQSMQQKEYEVQSLQQQLQQMVANFGQSFSQQFGTVYRSALDLIVEEKKLDIVFDGSTLFHVNTDLDISQEVLNKFDELTQASYQQLKTQLESQTAQ